MKPSLSHRFSTSIKSTVSLLLLGSMASITTAGECPEGQFERDTRNSGGTEQSGLSDELLVSVDLTSEAVKLEGYALRMRRITIAPGGTIRWHTHAERPSVTMVMSGKLTEYRSDCKVPVIHVAGDVVKEAEGLWHWWSNDSAEPAVLLGTDIRPPE